MPGLIRVLLVLLLVLCASAGFAQTRPTITLATVNPGDVYWQRFGHNTLIVDAHDGNETLSYNFGYFDFEQPDFLNRFLLGRMLYQALAIPAQEDLVGYAAENRSVHLQSLALNDQQAERLSGLLQQAVTPEHRDYLYEYFRANCSTRVRDALDTALDGLIRQQTAGRSRGATYRWHAMRLAQTNFWLSTGIDLGLGPDTDKPLSFWDEMFIPELMREHLRDVRTTAGTPLIKEETTWFDSGQPDSSARAPDRRLPFAIVGIVSAILLLWLGRNTRNNAGARRVLGFVAATLHLLFGFAGLILLFLWIGTDHVAAHRNENLFLLNPLSLLLVPFWMRAGKLSRSSHRFGNILATIVCLSAVFALLAKTLPTWFIQANLHWVLLLLPVHVALLLTWQRINR